MLHVLTYGHPLALTLALGMGAAPGPMLLAQSDMQPRTPPAQVEALQGRYDLWQDGEGGPLCTLRLTPQRTIGGFAVAGAAQCAQKLELAGDPHAWFVREDGVLLMLDAARQPLLYMRPLGQGEFKDSRQGDYVNAVILSPKRPPQSAK